MLVKLEAELLQVNLKFELFGHDVFGLLFGLLHHHNEPIVLQFFNAINQLLLVDVRVLHLPAILLDLSVHLVYLKYLLLTSQIE